MNKVIIITIAILALLSIFFSSHSTPVAPNLSSEYALVGESANQKEDILSDEKQVRGNDWYRVVAVVDGDTIKVLIGDTIETVRLIGVDTPETVHPSKPAECFGKEASSYTRSKLLNVRVLLDSDDTQGDRDKYGRLLRYVSRGEGSTFNEELIRDGYAREYTYETTYRYRDIFKSAEDVARNTQAGLWGDTCSSYSTDVVSRRSSTCLIKGNITKEKIYHTPECTLYDKTVIDESVGERWFCTEEEAIDAGWRKAKNCP